MAAPNAIMWRELFTLRADGPSWPGVLLLSAPVLIPLVGLAMTGRLLQGVLVALGAYIILFGSKQPVRRRIVTSVAAAAGMHLSVAIGMHAGDSLAATTAAYLAVAVIAVACDVMYPLGPPGPYFFALMVGGGTLLGTAGIGIDTAFPYLLVGNVLALLFGVAATTLSIGADPSATAPPTTRLSEAMTWPSPQLVTLLRVSVALPIASVASFAMGDSHPFWTVLVVVLVLSFPGDRRDLTARALQRLFGTSLGIAAFLALVQLPLERTGYLALLCVTFLGMGRYTARNYLYGSVLITLFALLLTVPLSPNEHVDAMAWSRWLDTLIAVAAAVAAVHFIPRSRT